MWLVGHPESFTWAAPSSKHEQIDACTSKVNSKKKKEKRAAETVLQVLLGFGYRGGRPKTVTVVRSLLPSTRPFARGTTFKAPTSQAAPPDFTLQSQLRPRAIFHSAPYKLPTHDYKIACIIVESLLKMLHWSPSNRQSGFHDQPRRALQQLGGHTCPLHARHATLLHECPNTFDRGLQSCSGFGR